MSWLMTRRVGPLESGHYEKQKSLPEFSPVRIFLIIQFAEEEFLDAAYLEHVLLLLSGNFPLLP